MLDYGYNSYGYSSSGLEATQGVAIWGLIAAILALVGGIIAYYLFVKPKKQWDNKFLAWLKEFLAFNKMWIEGLLKVCYIIAAIYVTLMSFSAFAAGFFPGILIFFGILIGGNIALRLIYEASLMFVMIWRNTKDINKKLDK